ncbi:DUF6339 family protein [Halosegnis rubeus]|uniref:Uncharacterized protein n=1 Tax=Halosegnis rubeus TaxID=2212850 RepID=A0A5N5UMI3_9EURY|nr:DUF6339 family protein [Halosegnis rubeus]KAB7518832.1 hypothetical protein DP108_06605 [Halosegnis rubeus]
MVDNTFLRGERDLTEDTLRPYLQPLGRSIDLSPVDERIKEIRASDEIEEQSSLIDAKLAPTLHRTLDLTRNEAADAGLWHYLCIVRFPDFVHYRWDHVFDPESPGNMEEKFLKAGTDAYSNALHRIWWGAELTYEEGESGDVEDRDYSRTKKVLSFQELANDILDHDFARYTPVTHACGDLLCHEKINQIKEDGAYANPPSNSNIVSRTTTLLREELTVRRVEMMEKDDIVETIKDLRDEVMRLEAGWS